MFLELHLCKLYCKAVFFNLFAAAEPSVMFALLVESYAMIQVSIFLQ